MADLQDFRDRLTELEITMNAELPKLANVLALSAKAISERTIKSVGFGYTYSTKKVPAYFFYGKELNQSGKAFLEKLEATDGEGVTTKSIEDITEADLIEGETNWGEFREAQGLQVSHVDLSYTNKMWASISPEPVTVENGVYTAVLGSTNKEGQDKMNWNHDRYGDFINDSLSDESRKQLSDVVAAGIDKIINNSKLIK